MKNIALQLILCMVAIHASWGMAVGLVLPDAIKRADLIAHIRIDDDLEISPRFKRTSNADGGVTIALLGGSDDPEAYTRIATASIVHTFKGGEGTGTIKIRHTNGFTCPNVIYQAGEEYIVFLRKEPDSDHYLTMNHYAGQFKMEDGQVIAFYLINNYKHPDDLRLPYGRVSTFLKESIKEQESP
ncbi:MAG TPA: hypothetical protein VNQ90_04590 [Chthoniobacteraceae bacterium]|nr:hypothetical protein [Chthoniobacteraceae bacterium]